MVDRSDLEEAVRAGVVSDDVALKLRNFSAVRRGSPSADEERFQLTDGMGDIATALAIGVLFLAAWFLFFLVTWIGFAATAVAAWALAEYFSVKRKLALTGIFLFIGFAVSAAMTCLVLTLLAASPEGSSTSQSLSPILALPVAAGSTLACLAWWLRFRLPFAYGLMIVAGINAFTHVLRIAMPIVPADLVSVYLLGVGIGVFLAALWWDMSDIRRETRRSDVAFWLHLLAGFQIASASARLILGVVDKQEGWDRMYNFTTLPPETSTAYVFVAAFICFCAVSLIVNRRSLLVSGIIFYLPGVWQITMATGELGAAMVGVVVAIILLLISLFWNNLRKLALMLLPTAVAAQFPRTDIEFGRERPVR